MKEDRVGLPGIGAPQNDEIRLLRLTIGAGSPACPEDRRQTDDAGGVSRPVAAVDVVAVEGRPSELLREKIHLVRRLRAAEEPESIAAVLRDRGSEPRGGAVESLIPGGRTQLSSLPHHGPGQSTMVLLHGHLTSFPRMLSLVRPCSQLRSPLEDVSVYARLRAGFTRPLLPACQRKGARRCWGMHRA